SPLRGDARNEFDVTPGRRFTHVRLRIYPDGGVARLRVHGVPVPDLTFLDLRGMDLAALENGARIFGCGAVFFASPSHLIAPAPAGAPAAANSPASPSIPTCWPESSAPRTPRPASA